MTLLRNKQSNNATLAGYVAAFVLIAVGATVSWLAIDCHNRARTSSEWPRVEGVVIQFERHLPAKGTAFYSVLYSYPFNQRSFESTRISFGIQSIGAEKLPALRAGQAIGVYVNPMRPEESVLVPGVDGGVWVFTIAGMITVFSGGLIGALSVRGARLCRQSVTL